MPFTIVAARADARLPLLVSYRRKTGRNGGKGTLPRLWLSFTSAGLAACNLTPGDALGLAVGSGDAGGRLRLIRAPACALGKLGRKGRGGAQIPSASMKPKLTLEFDWAPERAAPATKKAAPTIAAADDENDEIDEIDEADEEGSAAAARLSNGAAASRIEKNGICVDLTPDAEAISWRGKTMETTAKAARLLGYLAAVAPAPVDRGFLVQKLWPSIKPGSADEMLRQLVRKAEPAARAVGLDLATIKGVGIALREAA